MADGAVSSPANSDALDRDVEKATNKTSPASTATPSNDSHGKDEPKHENPKHDDAPRTTPPMSTAREMVFVALMCSAQLLTQAGLAESVASLRIISTSFHFPNEGQQSWFVAGYNLTVGTFILVAGRLGDMFGHKCLFIFGYAWFALWSLIAGLSVCSQSQIFFDVCRAMQGIGPAILLPNAMALLGRTYGSGQRKEMVFALFGACAPGGFVLGATFSALLAQKAWWPWAFWCMAIVCTLFTLGSFFIIPGPSKKDTHDDGPQTFDFLGATIGVAGLIFFNVAWNQAPVVGWQSPAMIVLLILGFLSLIAFFIVEKRVSQPLLPLEGLSTKVAIVLALISLGWSSFGIWLYYLWQFLQVLRYDTPLSVAAQLLPSAISGFCAGIVTGILLSRVKTAYIMTIALLAFCIGNIMLATMPVGQTYWIQTFLAVCITPWGMDMSFPAASVILSDYVPRHQQGIAASLVSTVVNYSISIGLGIAGTTQAYLARNGADVLTGYRGAWYSAIGLSGSGVLLSFYFIFHAYTDRK